MDSKRPTPITVGTIASKHFVVVAVVILLFYLEIKYFIF